MAKKNWIIAGVVLILVMGGYFIYRYTNRVVYNVGIKESDIKSIMISYKSKKINFDTADQIKSIFDEINGVESSLETESVNDSPTNADEYITIRINDTTGTKVIYVYEKDNNYYLEQPYNGIYQIDGNIYQSIYRYIESDGTGLDGYYNDALLSHYGDIRDLNKEYSLDDAAKDNCFVISHAKTYNDHLYMDFMDDYNNQFSSFIRIVQPTIEGDTIIYDVKYRNDINKVLIVFDPTRDGFSGYPDNQITLREYEKLGTYKYKTNEYWVAYKGELNDETLILTISLYWQ